MRDFLLGVSRKTWACALFLVLAASATTTFSLSYDGDPSRDRYYLAVVLDDGEEANMIATLQVAIERARYHAARGHEVDIRVIARDGGVDLYREDRSRLLDRLRFAERSFDTIRFYACDVTLAELAMIEGEDLDLAIPADRLSDADGEVEMLRAMGWTVIQHGAAPTPILAGI